MRRCRNRSPYRCEETVVAVHALQSRPAAGAGPTGEGRRAWTAGSAEGETWTCLLYRCFDNGMSRT